MRRKHLQAMKFAAEETAKYKKKAKRDLADDPHKISEIMARTLYKDSSTTGLAFVETIGADADFTLNQVNDLRPVVFSMLSKDDGKLYHCSFLYTSSEEVLRKRLEMNPFPVAAENWQEMAKGDVLDAMILTTFNFEGKPFDFREQYVGLQKVNLLIKNILSMEVPQGFAEED